MAKNYEIDNTDLKILEILTQDAKKPYTEVAKKVYVSQGTIHVRMNKMEEAGIVAGAVYRPLEVTVPAVAVQLVAPVDVNCWVAPRFKETVDGAMAAARMYALTRSILICSRTCFAAC